MGGGSLPPIPDYKQYNIHGLKELEWVESSLAAKGLKDPWLRNEVWRYRQWPGHMASLRTILGRGLVPALGLMAITIGVDFAFGISKKKHEEHH